MSRLKRILLPVLLAGSAFAWQPGATPAGSLLISSNLNLGWSNLTGGTFSNFLPPLTNTVAAIQGFTNYGSLYQGTTNGTSAGQSLVFPFLFTNWANSNSTFQFSVTSNLPWAVEITNLGAGYATNLAPFAGFTAYLRVQIPGGATNASLGVFTLTNLLAPSLTNRQAVYLGNNGFGYGGAKVFGDTVTIRVGGPLLTATRSVFVTNTLGGGIPWSDAVPGSFLTYSISYTNAGSATAYGVAFTESWDETKAGFVTNTATSGIGTNVSYATNLVWGYAPVANAGVADTRVDGVRFTLDAIPAGASGVLSYRLILR